MKKMEKDFYFSGKKNHVMEIILSMKYFYFSHLFILCSLLLSCIHTYEYSVKIQYRAGTPFYSRTNAHVIKLTRTQYITVYLSLFSFFFRQTFGVYRKRLQFSFECTQFLLPNRVGKCFNQIHKNGQKNRNFIIIIIKWMRKWLCPLWILFYS